MQQFLAKAGVFALIVVNLGAYYLFWPDSGGHSASADKGELVSNARAAQPEPWKPAPPAAEPAPLMPEPIETPTPLTPVAAREPSMPTPGGLPSIPEVAPPSESKPAELPKPFPDPVATGAPPVAPPVVVAQAEDTTKERLKKLMESINKDTNPPPLPLPIAPPPPLPQAAPPEPQPLGMLPKSEPTGPAPPKMAPVTPVTHKSPAKSMQAENSPWTLQWEIADGRTTLTARLNKRLDFRIVGDRVKIETPDGAVVALGKVSLTGPNLAGTCDKLTIALASDSITLEGKAELQVQQGNLSDLAIPTVDLKGEKFTLRLQQFTSNVLPIAGPRDPIAVPPRMPDVSPPTPSPFTIPGSFPGLQKKGL